MHSQALNYLFAALHSTSVDSAIESKHPRSKEY
jgi:hypothetical protein